LLVHRNGAHVAATGTVRRRDFAIRGMSGLVGDSVRVQLQSVLPASAANALQ
jgi:hypothetical protein